MNNNKKLYIIIATSAVVLFGLIGTMLNINDNTKSKPNVNVHEIELKDNAFSSDNTSNIEPNINTDSQNIIIYISGEVVNPGVYELKSDSRVQDVLEKAGGFTEDADQNAVNLAKKISDEEHIVIPKKNNEINNTTTSNNTISNNKTTNKININTATKEELMTLDGIGETIASSIIEYRQVNGNFNNIDELKKVNRIGDKTYDKIKDNITV